MKKPKYLAIALILILFSLAFAGCRGSGAVASSWPGITVDGDNAYVAFNQAVYTLDLENDGRVRETMPGNAGDLRPRNPMFYHAPVLLDESTLLVGSYNNRMFTINLNTGNADDFFISARNRWIAQPLLADGTIYAPNAPTATCTPWRSTAARNGPSRPTPPFGPPRSSMTAGST